MGSCYSSSVSVPFPYEQDDLYGAEQPALFLLDQGDMLWLWEGWIEAADGDDADEDPAILQRHRLARLFALRTAHEYAALKFGTGDDLRSRVVYAGLEPSEFVALFPCWQTNDQAKKYNRAVRAASLASVCLKLIPSV